MGWLFQGSERELQALPEAEFVGVWAALFGEPPAAIIDRAEMIAMMQLAFPSSRPRCLDPRAGALRRSVGRSPDSRARSEGRP